MPVQSPSPQDEHVTKFINDVRSWYARNENGFRDAFAAAVAGVKSIPENTDPAITFDWRNATIDTLTEFFRDWYGWDPDLASGLSFIEKFSWLYYENDDGRQFVMHSQGLQMTLEFVTIKARWMNSSDSQPLVAAWIDELGSEMDQYVIPPRGYQSFNEFFARSLRGGSRPVCQPQDDSVVVSPSDAIVNMIQDDLQLDTQLQIKTQKLNVRQLLDQSPFAESFAGGTALSCVLMPTVYHRFHAPVSGRVIDSNEDVAGAYFGIEDFPQLLNKGNVGYEYDYSVFEHFRRGYLIIETDRYGRVGMVPVGLNTIGSVILSHQFKRVAPGDVPVPVNKGDEVGYFQYGGSLNILLFEKGCFPSVRIPQGQVIGTLNEKRKDAPQFVY